jgi:hypothetical protein
MNRYYKFTVNLPEGELLQYIEVASSPADSQAELWPVRQAEFFQDKWSFYSTTTNSQYLADQPVSKQHEMPENIISAGEFEGIWAIGNSKAMPEALRTSLSLVQGYVPDRSPTEVVTELERIYRKADGLYLEIYISDYLKAGRQRSMKQSIDMTTEQQKPLVDSKRAELAAIRERSVNPDQDLQMLAAELADQLQELWGWLD